MSAQGATLKRRGAIRIPLWPMIAVVIVATVALVGVELLQDRREQAPAASTTQVGQSWASQVAHPALRRGTAPVLDAAVIESSAAAVREQGAGGPFHAAGRAHEVVLGEGASTVTRATAGGPFHAIGRAHEVVLGEGVAAITYATGLENPGAWITSETGGSPGPAPQPGGDCDHCKQQI